MTPPFPIISINNRKGLDILNGDYPLDRMTLYAFTKDDPEEWIYFDKDGNKWKSSVRSDKYKPSLFTKLLASTVYNPIIKVHQTWLRIGAYPLAELIEAINHCIDSDDDILTQYVEPSQLKLKVNECDSFRQLVKILYDFVFRPNSQMIDESL